MLAEKLYTEGPAFAEAWNFGPHGDDAKPVEWIVRQLAQKWSNGASWQIDEGDHPHEATYLKLDISKADHYLGWQPAMRLDHALGLIVDWARGKQAGADLRALTQAQIEAYQVQAGASNPT